MDAFTPQQTIELVSRIGCKKAHMRLDKLFINSIMAGPLLGFGCAILVSTNASSWYQDNAPGLIRTLGALLFPVGLVMIVLSGADLFTSNVMFMSTAYLHRRVSILDIGTSWFFSFFGNLAGSLFFMAIITGYGGVFEESEEYREAAIRIAIQKCVNPQWHQIFLRAIGANWLVCFAVFISISSREISSKIMAIWWPTATFVALALDHVVANMFFIPMGIWVGAPISVGYYIWKSMIPTALGNLVGGGLFVATAYWYLYLTGEVGVAVSFDIGSLSTAEQKDRQRLRNSQEQQYGGVVEGIDPNETSEKSPPSTSQAARPDTLPHSGSPLMSGLAKELGDGTKYTKSHSERTGSGRGGNGDEKV
ncbi:hypothetical protein K490DRAFT_60208 [Saccharata proteae CBS 121410]|uniref:Formate/nitrite transporter n=1 Tax=Saccharata proteae CBS 121410 TaxID=1314787 RepID=A0A9P4HQG5_9PEZI|nr:hypothetical protein K490DRAFT_60208 [Saccharata proteae CBS 121410]